MPVVLTAQGFLLSTPEQAIKLRDESIERVKPKQKLEVAKHYNGTGSRAKVKPAEQQWEVASSGAAQPRRPGSSMSVASSSRLQQSDAGSESLTPSRTTPASSRDACFTPAPDAESAAASATHPIALPLRRNRDALGSSPAPPTDDEGARDATRRPAKRASGWFGKTKAKK